LLKPYNEIKKIILKIMPVTKRFLDKLKELKPKVKVLLFTSQPMDSIFIKVPLTIAQGSVISEA
jgi:hypothetical protein